jgi:hypothetical protein
MQAASNSVESLFADLEHAKCDLANTRNSFSALAHSQFVENRVAEEEEEVVPVAPPETHNVATNLVSFLFILTPFLQGNKLTFVH